MAEFESERKCAGRKPNTPSPTLPLLSLAELCPSKKPLNVSLGNLQ